MRIDRVYTKAGDKVLRDSRDMRCLRAATWFAVLGACSGAPAKPRVGEVPFGAWESTISPEVAAASFRELDEPQYDVAGNVYWLEMLASGRSALMRRKRGGASEELVRDEDVRSEVHAYGGGALLVTPEAVIYTNAATRDLLALVGDARYPIASNHPHAWLVDCANDAKRGRLVCVREDDGSGMPTDSLVSVKRDTAPVQLIAGHDFFGQPRISPDGSQLSWLTWELPRMPWTGTELWVAPLAVDGSLGTPSKIAGGPTESIYQAQWSPGGELYFTSDRTNYWGLYRVHAGAVAPVWVTKAEVGLPAWTLNRPMFDFASPTQIVAAAIDDGVGKLVTIDTSSGAVVQVPFGYDVVRGGVRAHDGHAVMLAANAEEALSVVEVELATGKTTVLARENNATIAPALIAKPEAITYPTNDGGHGYAYYYPPTNPAYRAPAGEKPPLVVRAHGGPTGRFDHYVNSAVLYWTSRGFGVVDVNYGGSTGHGRRYRERLAGGWGVVDVDDCIAAAKLLVDRGSVDGKRLLIRGGSAGGYTTLAAVAFRDVFRAGASWYGIGDLEKMDAATQASDKFESGYTQLLVGPYPARQDLFRARSPFYSADRIKAPVIFFQGTDDPVVPAEQSRMMHAALKERGIATDYIEYPGEKHGFRKLENNARSLREELTFYRRVLGIGAVL